MQKKFHVALSFAGEDRQYVDAVAKTLKANGIEVFYDLFEEVDLWGKDLYTHLTDVYQNQAFFTVMFVSDAYCKKLWTNHERKSAQARAFTDNHEYILPAFFDESVEVPGLLKTTGHIALKNRTPADLAELIINKLQSKGIRPKHSFSYSEDAKSDVDFPLTNGNKIADLIKMMKTHEWPKQNRAVTSVLQLDWKLVSSDEAFVLGRNLYQCACGKEWRASSFLSSLRQELASIPLKQALDLLNGMFFEVYFDSTGKFRSNKIKGGQLEQLLTIQTVKKYEPALLFIQQSLHPYRNMLPFIPSIEPQEVVMELSIKQSDPPLLNELTIGGYSLLSTDNDNNNLERKLWGLSFGSFTVKELKQELANELSIPFDLLSFKSNYELDPKLELKLQDGVSIQRPSYT